MKCIKECESTKAPCENRQCRYWINYSEDLNCSLICINENGAMTLKEVAKRIGVSYVRIKQIQDIAIKKINKKMLEL
tara:strand:- start:4069 stop:4299 length:231 start_codon:yes stop_codon:yes gene_type:complete